jgi:putative selenate reductase
MAVRDLYPFEFNALVARLQRELAGAGPVYLINRKDLWRPPEGVDLSHSHFGTRVANPAGVASGPHTQLAQNLVMSWLVGARFLELKTVQINDELEIPRPCIDVPHIGYNVEWSQELRVAESALEYAKGWWLVHLAAEQLGMAPDSVFDVSLGYDLAGIRTDKVRGFLDAMADASALYDSLNRPDLPRPPARISDTLTLSTFHGCPADEIESIARQTLDWGWHTIVKLNPTLLGYETVRGHLDDMGYQHITLNPQDFEKDLTWDQMLAMVERLKAHAAGLGRGFGVKFTNTLVCRSDEPNFAPGQEMYLSGPPLHALSFTLARRFMEQGLDVPVTFSAGVDGKNLADCVALGMAPVTTCSDLLKGKGYARMGSQLKNLVKRMGECTDLPSFQALGSSAEPLKDPRYHRAANQKPPRKIDSALELLDCLTCDKCIPVCPNGANLRVEMEPQEHTLQKVSWTGSAYTLAEGDPLVVSKRHQIGNIADACNLCGQCDTWCPETGGPYIEKPSLFVSHDAFVEQTGRDGMHIARGAISWRRNGELFRFAPGRLETPEGVVHLDGERVIATEGRGDVDLRIMKTMALYLDGFGRAETWTC